MRPREMRGWLAAKVIKQRRYEASMKASATITVGGEQFATGNVTSSDTIPAPPIGAREIQFSASASLSPEDALKFQRDDFCALLPHGYALVWGLPDGESCVCRVRVIGVERRLFPLDRC